MPICLSFLFGDSGWGQRVSFRTKTKDEDEGENDVSEI